VCLCVSVAMTLCVEFVCSMMCVFLYLLSACLHGIVHGACGSLFCVCVFACLLFALSLLCVECEHIRVLLVCSTCANSLLLLCMECVAARTALILLCYLCAWSVRGSCTCLCTCVCLLWYGWRCAWSVSTRSTCACASASSGGAVTLFAWSVSCPLCVRRV